jgi:hypothetical protein
MTTATSPAPEDGMNKRLKQVDDGASSSESQSIPPAPVDQSHRYPPPPQAQHYGVGIPQNPPPPHGPPGGYYGVPPPQHYGIHGPPPPPPPHHWQGGSQPPPPGRYPAGPPPPGSLSPERMNGGPPWSQHGGYRDSSNLKGQKSKSKRERGDEYHYSHRPPPGYQGPPPGYGPPPHWQSGAPLPPPMYTSQGTWTGKSPPRSGSRHHDPYRHDMDLPPYMGHGPESVDDDGGSSTADSNREKGRGSYKCGRVRNVSMVITL